MSRHHKAAKWANLSPRLRERIAPTLPRPCLHCGKPVLPGQRWDVAHVRDLARGGGVGHVGPAHAQCNRSAGGKLGAAIRNRPTASRNGSTREANW